MKFTEIEEAVEILMSSKSNKICYIEGHAGIGKSQLISSLVRKKNKIYDYEIKNAIKEITSDISGEFKEYEDNDYEFVHITEDEDYVLIKEWKSNKIELFKFVDGKTDELVDSVVLSNRKYKDITIFGSVVKEGELGGIPIFDTGISNDMGNAFKTTMKHLFKNDDKSFISKLKGLFSSNEFKNEFFDKVNIEKNSLGINTYTVFWKIKEIKDAVNLGYKTILFIDELNRTEIAVQEELLQLILDRKINTAQLPPKEDCFIIAAGNPETNEENLDYNVNIMNPAFKDRMTKLTMEADVNDWVSWAQYNGINDKVVSFIADYTELLHKIDRDSDTHPTPRSWEAVSDNLNEIEKSGKKVSNSVYHSILAGDIGLQASQSLLSHFENTNNPTITANDIFQHRGHSIPDELKFKIEKDSHPRLIITNSKCISYLDEKFKNDNLKAEDVSKYSEFINHIPKDLLYSVVKQLSINNSDLFDKLNQFKLKGEVANYIDLFFETNKLLQSNN